VFVQPDEAANTSSGGIVLTGKQEKSSVGTIMAVGPGTSEHPMVLQAGQKVLYTKYAGSEVEWNGHKFLVMKQDDVVGTIEE
jgi:chaperonin GroES